MNPKSHGALLALAMIVVSALTLAPLQAPPSTHWLGMDKLAHLVCWAGIGFLGFPVFRRCWPAFGLAGAHGALIELVEIPIPGRSGELLDLVADLLGAAPGVALARPLWGRSSTGRG